MSTTDLPKVHLRFERSACKTCLCNMQDEDKRLKNWKTWMDIRKETHKMIAAQTGRESGDMIMNSAESLHENNENRLIIQYTKVPNKLDKYRGCPAFFELPESLFEKYWKRSPTYFSVMTKEKQCIVPDLEYIRTGDFIVEEKGIKPPINNSKLTFLKSKYLQQRRKELQEKLCEIEPHKPTGDFSIIGTSISRNFSNYHMDDCGIPTESVLDYVSSPLERVFPIFKINNETIYNNSEGLKIININIEFDIASTEVRTDFLSITNYSSKALRFSFLKIINGNNFEAYNMLNDVKQQAFFFNLNKFVVIPQQTKHLPIYFKSKSEGIYKETWDLIIVPDLWRPNQLKLQLNLNCVAVLKSFDTRSALIKENLQNRARERIIDESLRKILATVPENKSEYVVYRYDKATLFEAINSSFSPINLRPKYIYNKSVVAELEKFYSTTIKLDHHPDVWNLNLNTLKQYTIEREIHNKQLQLQEQHKLLEEKIRKAEIVRNAREELRQKLLTENNANTKSATKAGSKTGKGGKKSKTPSPKASKSVKSKNSKSKSKKNAKASLKSGNDKADIVVPLIKRQDIQKTLTQELDDIIMKLHQPMTWINEQQQKLIAAYSLFCAYFDKIECDIIQLNIDFNANTFTAYPILPDFISPIPLRMISEYHDETMMQVGKFYETCGTLQDKRAEPWVDEIPIEDYEKRYRAFHCIVDDVKPINKKGKGSDKKGSKKDSKKDKASIKSKKSAAKSAKSVQKPKEDRPLLTVIQYDPYAEIKLPKSRAASLVLSSTVRTSIIESEAAEYNEAKQGDIELYKNNLYTIFYDHLARAVEDLEALLILQSKLTIKHNIIQKVTDGYTVQTNNEPETVKIVDLRRVISESLNSKEESLHFTPQRPCYKPFATPRSINRAISDSSIWDILQKPKVPTKPLQPGEYTITKTTSLVETREASTSVTHLETNFNLLGSQDNEVQVETWELPRNLNCDLYCKCDEETTEQQACKETQSKIKLKVKTASQNLYPELMIEGTFNFKFYEDSSDVEQVEAQDNKSCQKSFGSKSFNL